MVRSRVAFALCLVSMASAGAAQEEGTVPGAIPDPSTYQGSMEMQRQSDAQDQQFRDQQQQQSQQQQSYGPSQSSSSYGAPAQRGSQGVAARSPVPLNPLAAAFQRGDYPTVLKILRPKALAGNASAQHNLGFMYEKGY